MDGLTLLAITPVEMMGLYVAIPAAIIAVTTLLVVLPSTRRRPRYRPGRSWSADPVWFGAPQEPERAVEAAVPDGGTGGSRGRW